jgi:hypothetical protein
MNAPVRESLNRLGLAALDGTTIQKELGREALKGLSSLSDSFSQLVQDSQMGDGGKYRFRRYSRFLAERRYPGDRISFSLIAGNAIHQLKRDNPLNGGVTRTYSPLAKETLASPLLKGLMDHDARVLLELDPDFFAGPVTTGVHQVRIVARSEARGLPTPEGIHRDAEAYTFQHFWSKNGVQGGEFRGYDRNKVENFRWLQETPLDSVVFLGTTWHSATPISCKPGLDVGYRDIFLIDFDPTPDPRRPSQDP